MLSEEERMRQRILPYEASTGSTFFYRGTAITTDFSYQLREIQTSSTNRPLSYLTEAYENTLKSLIARVWTLEHEVNELRSSSSAPHSQGQTRLDLMRKIADSVLQRSFVPAGKYVAISFDGKLVAVADDQIGILKHTQTREEDLFIWKVGTGPIESW